MSCTGKNRLLDEYSVATQRLAHVVARFGGSLDLPPMERVQLERIVDDARRSYGQTMAALEAHLLLHGC